jgi:competence ComEA-like helix-hairpin-helix protein
MAWFCVTGFQLVRWFAGGVAAAVAPPRPFAEPVEIDVNAARVGELGALPGIGRRRAEAIVLYRLRHGPFRSAADLARVDGLGPDSVARLEPFVRVR